MPTFYALAMIAAVPVLGLSACAAGYGGGVNVGGPYAYEGYYDNYYGSVYDGYWGDDGGFYYRNGANDRRFRRGDPSHFNRSAAPSANFSAMRGSMTPSRGMRMPHFSGGGARGGSGGRPHR